MSFIVTAKYTGQIDDRRERRIHAVFERCGLRLSDDQREQRKQHAQAVVERAGRPYDVYANFGLGPEYDVTWVKQFAAEDALDFDLVISGCAKIASEELSITVDEQERATRLASELRACGLVVSTADS
jgi:hypothetical protein